MSDNCKLNVIQDSLPPDVTITSTKFSASPVSYCHITGFITTQGPAPTTNQVDFMLALPNVFHHRYYYIGLGGAAGYVPDPPQELLQQGFAIASSDGGSPGRGLGYDFGWDRTKGVDFGHRAIHRTTLVTQDITKRYYTINDDDEESSDSKLYRYFSGCSAGGRAANVESLLYPNDFDGIIAAAFPQWPQSILRAGWITQFLLENPDAWLSPEQLTQISNTILTRFDDVDGAKDGLLWDPNKLDIDFSKLDIVLNHNQIELLERITGGMDLFGVTALGIPLTNPINLSAIYGSYPPNEWQDTTKRSGFFRSMDSNSRALFGPDYDFTDAMDFTNPGNVFEWVQTFNSTFIGSGSLNPANLTPFRKAGGKIIYWHGVSDGGVSALDTIRYYDRLAAYQQGYSQAQSFARLFLVPGMNHCGGGVGPTREDFTAQALTALIQWVEKKEPPKSLTTRNSERSFLLCPYPSISVFKGGLENRKNLPINDAGNWSCQSPKN